MPFFSVFTNCCAVPGQMESEAIPRWKIIIQQPILENGSLAAA